MSLHLDVISYDHLTKEKAVFSIPTHPDKQKHKVSLQKFREESHEIFSIMRKHCSIVEKASIDEAFMDVTSEVAEMRKFVSSQNENWNGKVVVQEDYKPMNEADFDLVCASKIASKIREEIFMKLGYTCSAGVAHNKMLAKLGSNYNKPNGQTIIPSSLACKFMDELLIKRVRMFGGKVGKMCEEKGILTIKQLKEAGDEILLQMFKYNYFMQRRKTRIYKN
jgi:DNA polymerase eta